MKEIGVEVLLNENYEGEEITLSDEDADKLLALWQEALDTILKDMDDEDYWEKFDPWLKEKDAKLYGKVNNGYCEAFGTRMCSEPWDDDDNQYVSMSRDIDGVYLDDCNEIVVNQIIPISR